MASIFGINRFFTCCRATHGLNLTTDGQDMYMDKSFGQAGPKSITRSYRVDRRRISYIKFILEAYDNLAVVSTVDPRQAIIRIVTTPGCESLVNEIMKHFSRDFQVDSIDVGTDAGDPQYAPRAGRTNQNQTALCKRE